MLDEPVRPCHECPRALERVGRADEAGHRVDHRLTQGGQGRSVRVGVGEIREEEPVAVRICRTNARYATAAARRSARGSPVSVARDIVLARSSTTLSRDGTQQRRPIRDPLVERRAFDPDRLRDAAHGDRGRGRRTRGSGERRRRSRRWRCGRGRDSSRSHHRLLTLAVKAIQCSHQELDPDVAGQSGSERSRWLRRRYSDPRPGGRPGGDRARLAQARGRGGVRRRTRAVWLARWAVAPRPAAPASPRPLGDRLPAWPAPRGLHLQRRPQLGAGARACSAWPSRWTACRSRSREPILVAHVGMDRAVGYGLKLSDVLPRHPPRPHGPREVGPTPELPRGAPSRRDARGAMSCRLGRDRRVRASDRPRP